jgi:chloramphenicol 3-O phosphotransferase
VSDAGVVVVLDGPSCVGRSTTLAGLQAAWPEVRSGPLLEVGLDAMLDSFGPGERRWHRLILPDVARSEGGTAPHVHWGPLGREMVVAMHRAAAAWARAGVDVAIDHLLLDHATARDLASCLDGLRVVHVGLTCDPDVLEERERELHGATGMAVAQLHTTADVAIRDLVLDTSQSTTDELVEAVLIDVRRRLRARR